MERALKYRNILMEVLEAYTNDGKVTRYAPDDMQTLVVADTQNDHYQVLHTGWRNGKQIFTVVFHFDIINGKIWVRRNISDYDLIGDIETKGVPKTDIVLAFHAPEMRPFTDYAVA
ncbi:MAG: XisI protein [Saprospiraceae bacterium]